MTVWLTNEITMKKWFYLRILSCLLVAISVAAAFGFVLCCRSNPRYHQIARWLTYGMLVAFALPFVAADLHREGKISQSTLKKGTAYAGWLLLLLFFDWIN